MLPLYSFPAEHRSFALLTWDDLLLNQDPVPSSTPQCWCNSPYLLLFISVPEAVRLINATVRSDTSLLVSWRESHKPNGPKESVRYQLAISHLALIPETPLRRSEYPNGRLALLVTRLSGGKLYVLKVRRGSWALLLPFLSARFWKR